MEKIKFALERFFYGWKMNAFAFDSKNQILACYMGTKELVTSDCEELDTEIFHVEDNAWFGKIRQKATDAGCPVICMEEDGIYYLAFVDDAVWLYLFGPASIEKLTFAQQIAYRKRHSIKNQNYMVPRISLGNALNGIALVYYMLTERQVTEENIMHVSGMYNEQRDTYSQMTVYETKNSTEQKQHLAYQDELKWLSQVENGTLHAIENRMTPENLAKLEKIGTLSTDNSLKQFEYMVVSSTVLATRAAIRGGVNAYDAYSISELFLQKISKCTNAMEILQIHSEVAEEFANRVRMAKENRNYDGVEQCKDYIARHRTKKFSLEDVANYVGKNPSYLSRIFSEQMGMTMQEYALQVRLEAAANLLSHSNEGVGEIAEYLNFPSQSYFGACFKKKYGVTPAVYRKQHKIRDFKE